MVAGMFQKHFSNLEEYKLDITYNFPFKERWISKWVKSILILVAFSLLGKTNFYLG